MQEVPFRRMFNDCYREFTLLKIIGENDRTCISFSDNYNKGDLAIILVCLL